MWRNRSLPVASHAAARVPIRIERRAFPSLSIPDTRERCERRARLETLTPRDNTDLALVNSGYSKTKLRRGFPTGVSLSEFFPHHTHRPVPIGDSRRPNGTASTPHRIGEISQTGIFRDCASYRMGILPELQRYFGKSAESSGSGTPARGLGCDPKPGLSTVGPDDGLQIKTGAASPPLPPLLLLLMVLCLDGARRCHFLRARALATNAPASTMGKKWLPLESNPEVMADFAHA